MKLTEKQETLLEFIKRFQEDKGRNPRLTELTSKFGVSNSAILQHLKALEESGYIDMPEGVLSISTRPRFDIFVSYSNDDREIANKIYDRLRLEGFRVWKDNIKLRTGDYFASEIFKAIRSSKVFLLLLSDSALRSKFVKEELAHAKHYSIYKGNPKTYPVVIQNLTGELPPEISNLQRKKLLNIDDDSQIIQFLDEIQTKIFSRPSDQGEKVFDSGFSAFKKRALADLEGNVKLKDDYDYFEFFLQPLENPGIDNVMQIEKLLEATAVDIKRWGGFNIPPFYQTSDNLKTIATRTDLRFIKEFSGKEAWFRSWELYCYYFDKNGNFFYRNSLRESFANEENIRGTFSIDWLVLDVTRSLMFVKNVLNKTSCKKWRYTLHYHGLKGKRLVILNQRRAPLFRGYRMEGDNDYEISVEMKEDKSIIETAYNICYEILWLFGWKNINEQMLKSDITSVSEGVFPE